MANPLAAFRKYQKTMLVIAAGGAMIAFGILPILSDWQQQAGRGGGGGAVAQTATAVSWDGGKLQEGQLYDQRVLRNQLVAFQQTVIQTANSRGVQPRQRVIPNSNAEANIVESLLLASEAERMGIRIGDDAVKTHLTQHLANDALNGDELAKILRDTTGGRLSEKQLFEGLRTELAAHQLRVMANGSAFTGGIMDSAVPPAQMFDYYKRLNRRMEAELLALNAADFLDQVKEEPTDAEVQAMYDEYKDVVHQPIDPTPGFKVPTKIAFQWLKSDFNEFPNREMDKLTEEEIQQYYDENKTSYRKVTLPTSGDLELDFGDDSADTDEIDLSTPDGEAETPEATDTPEATEVDETESEETPVDTTPAVEDGSSNNFRTTTKNVVLQVDDAAAAVTDAVEEATTTAASPDEAVTEAEDEGTISLEESVSDITDPAAENSAAEDSTTEDAGTTEESDELQVEYQPLEEVREDIKNVLARPRATEASKKAMDEVFGELKSYFDKFMYWETTPEADRGAQPTPPNIQDLATKLGLVPGESEEVGPFEARNLPIGSSMDFDMRTQRAISFVQKAFGANITAYNPQRMYGGGDERDAQYVFWKTTESETYVPSLEEAKPAVVRHWKMKKALALAKAEGERIAKQLTANNQSLQAAFGDDDTKTVKETGVFTWMTYGGVASGQGTPRISFVPGTEFDGMDSTAGHDFMREVSKLDSGGVCVASNYPETVAYVVYMKGIIASKDDLQNGFLNDGFKVPLMYMARQDSLETASDWYTALEKARNVKWERPPAGATPIR